MDLVTALHSALPADHDLDHLGRPVPGHHDTLDQLPDDGPAIGHRRRVRAPQRGHVGRQRPNPFPVLCRQVPRLLVLEPGVLLVQPPFLGQFLLPLPLQLPGN